MPDAPFATALITVRHTSHSSATIMVSLRCTLLTATPPTFVTLLPTSLFPHKLFREAGDATEPVGLLGRAIAMLSSGTYRII